MTTPRLVRSIAECFQRAVGTARFACDADFAAVMNELMRELDPVIAGDDLHQVLFDLFGIAGFREPKAVGKAQDVGVDDDAFGNSIGNTKNDIGGLTRGSWNCKEFGHALRDLTAEVRDYTFCGA